MGQIPLQDKFVRFFNVSLQKSLLISDMGRWENGTWRWSFVWRMAILPREEEAMAEFLSYVQTNSLVEGRADRWVWGESEEGVYTVKSAFLLLQGMEMEEPVPVTCVSSFMANCSPIKCVRVRLEGDVGETSNKAKFAEARNPTFLPTDAETTCVFCLELEGRNLGAPPPYLFVLLSCLVSVL